MSPSSPRPGTPLWLQRLRPGSSRKQETIKPPDPLRSAGQRLREAREAKGLGLRDLAQQTRISIAVLEALERGWKDRLPEVTYLRAMVPLLEQHLDLPTGSLEPVLPHADRGIRGHGNRAGQAAPFSPSTLALLSSWQSNLLYGGLVAGLLYGVNLQQQRLAAMGRLSVSPIPVAPAQSKVPEERIATFPDLHPLAQAAKGQAMDLLFQENQRSWPDLSLGLLQLNLSEPPQMDLRSLRGGRTQLEGLAGNLSLPVLPPFELHLKPAPAPSTVRWRGQVVKPKVVNTNVSSQTPTDQGGTGVYVIPLPPDPKPTPTPVKTP
ncbi:MAG: helix-turn-helix domain-containing protein [Cyanobacteriota bacterium]